LKFISNSLQAEFEDTKGAIIIRISKKNRQHNGQKKKYKGTNNEQQNINIKLEQELPTLPEHLSSSPVLSEVRVTRSLVLY
jgi:hypothetical protein